MEKGSKRSSFMEGLVLLLSIVSVTTSTTAQSVNYYSKTCPDATTIVKNTVSQILKGNQNIAGGLLRLHFHDCFVRGCDGSVLLNGPSSEKTALPNQALRGFKEIDRIKKAVEAKCPGIVSCADILALAARDATVAVGGSSWTVDLGRKDGFVSRESEALQKLPSPFMTFDELVQNFAAVGLSRDEMVVLSGGHTIGRSTCEPVKPRLYDYDGVEGAVDPKLDASFAAQLKKSCPENGDGKTLSMDSTRNKFDTAYFGAVLANKGLFESDANLLTNARGKSLVTKYSQQGGQFSKDFAAAMRKMSNIEWLFSGEVRKVCSSVN